ncbi:methyltransferase domain-containing protein [Pelagibacteraceae bacterium]|nr:methyltransferase domain-containing protein [Pelagibacteraceae bacterium]
MTIRRTNRNNQKKWLQANRTLKILDLGCSVNSYWKEANHFADIEDHTEYFKNLNLNYTCIKPDEKLPFKDKEFDYVILSHVLEHVNDPFMLRAEIERVGKAGYIELPTKLCDNIIFVPKNDALGHKWWFEFDDDKQEMVFEKKVEALESFLSVGSVWKLSKIFDDSFTIQLYWENSMNLSKKSPYLIDEKITFSSLVKKYYSKKIRVFISVIKNIFK